MSVFPSDERIYFYEFEPGSRDLIKSTSEALDASLDVLTNLVEWCLLFNKQINFWDVFSLKYTNICCLFPQDTVYSRYPYQEGTIDQWFKLPPESGVPQTRNTVNILNVLQEKRKDYPPLYGKEFRSPPQEGDGFVVLFHGTNHDSAKNILQEGIRLDKLDKARTQDFSNGEGFYLSTDYTKIFEEWACRRNRNQAVLTFKLPQSVLDRFKESSIDLKRDDHKKEWKDHVQKCHSTDRKIKKKLKQELNNVSYVEGPWARLKVDDQCKRASKRGINNFIAYGAHSHQICLLSKELAEEVDSYLDSVIFF